MLPFKDFEKYFAHLDIFMSFFITGYFGLYAVYGEIFLNYDILTRIVLSISASFVLFMTFTRPKEGKRFQYLLAQSVNIILVFTTIKLLKFNTILKENPLWYILLFLSIWLLNRVSIYGGQMLDKRKKGEGKS